MLIHQLLIARCLIGGLICLGLKTRMRGGNQIGAGQLYVHWVKEQVEKNIPFDEMAYNLVTAEGYPWEDGAVGYYPRDAGMPLDNMSNTTQIFLGTQNGLCTVP